MALALLQSTAAPATAPYTVECNETTYAQVFATFGNERFSQRTSEATQKYVVDPTAKTVTTLFATSDSGQRIEKQHTYRDVMLTPSGRVVFCQRTDGSKCLVKHPLTQERRTIDFTTGQTVLDMAKGRITSWGNFEVEGDDGSRYHDFRMTEGTCRRL